MDSNNKSTPVKTNQPHLSLNCPRCGSCNTKFCYYNNYSLSQPRHFCRACKRYWTRGGTLRNVPIGGGCRKNKRDRRRRAGIISPTPVFPNPRYEDQQLNMPRSLNYVDDSSMFCSGPADPVALDFPVSRVDGAGRVSSDLGLGFVPSMATSNQIGLLREIQDAIAHSNSGDKYGSFIFGSTSLAASTSSANPNWMGQIVNYCDASSIPWNMINFGDRID